MDRHFSDYEEGDEEGGGDDQDGNDQYNEQPPRKQQPPREATPPPAPKTAAELREEGNTHFRAQDYKRAVECYSQAIALDPDPVYYGNRAAAYLMQELYSKAIEDCKFVLARQPDDVKAHLRVGKAYLKKGDLTDARRHLARVLELEPGNTQAKPELQQLAQVEELGKKASAALAAQNYRLCLTTTEQGLTTSPFSVQLRTLKGEALLGLRQFGAAGSLAVSVLRDNPQNPDALYVRGMSLYYTGNMEDASKLLMSALKCDPDHAKARAARKRVRDLMQLKEEGNVQFSARQYKEAHQTYSRAMEVDPLNDALMAILHFNRALAGTKIGFQEQAIADCTAALKLDPTYLKARKLRIELYQKAGRHREAVAELRSWSTEEPENRDLLRQLRDAELEQKKADRPDYYAILGVAKNATVKDIKKAFKQKALQFHPDKNSATEEQRAAADVKFKQINEANEVLSDAEKRAAYDRGDDLDDMGGHAHSHGFGGHGHRQPFEHFFRHAQGGGGGGGYGGFGSGGFNF